MTRIAFSLTLGLCLTAMATAQNSVAPDTEPAVRTAPAPADEDTARWLAGLPQNGSLKAFNLVPAWKEHAAELDKAWAESERDRLTKVRAWAPAALGTACTGDSPVFYFFSGADFLYPHALFPNAKTYVMCAREPVGSQPDPTRIAAEELPVALATFRKSLSTLLDFSYFITTDLRRDVEQRAIPGILPVLELILARQGHRVIEVLPVRCDAGGTLSMSAKVKGGSPGVRIRFKRGEQPEQTLYYFYGDLSNTGLKTHGGVLKFCESLGRGRGLLKAASFLPHESGFSRIDEWLLANCNAIVQDPSGIPIRQFAAGKWKLRFWGRNPEPIELFAKYGQQELRDALASGPGLKIPFGFGYQFEPETSLLILAERTPAN